MWWADRYVGVGESWGRTVAAIGLGLTISTEAGAYEPLFDTWMGFPSGTYATGRFPYAADAGDLNGDGAVDVVVAQWPWATGFSLLVNRGDGTFLEAVQHPSAFPSLDVRLGDVDLDGDLDVVLSNTGVNYEGGTISVYLNDGTGSFGPQQQFSVGGGSYPGPYGIAVEDFDGDGLPDIAVALYGWIGQGDTVALLRGDGTGGFGPPTEFPAGVGSCTLASDDIDADGRPDLAVANHGSGIHTASVLINDGSGGFLAPVAYSASMGTVGGYPAVHLADVDNDGDVDLLRSDSGTRVGLSPDYGAVLLYRNQGDGTMGPWETILMHAWTAGPRDLEVADINEDGWLDVFGVYASGRSEDGWQLALNDGSGGFLPATLHAAGQTTYCVMVADADGDGDRDVLTADNYTMVVTFHENSGFGTFRAPPSYPTNPLSLYIDAADVDLDGDLDVLTTGGVIYPIAAAVLLNQGDGSFGPHQTLTGFGTCFGKLRDLNGDDLPDIVLAGDGSYSFHTAMGNGDGTFGPFLSWPVASCGAGDIDALDLDNDGDRDVVYLEYLGCPSGGANRVFISLNHGNGTFAAPYTVQVDVGPYQVVGADFNEDGNVDIATAHYGFYGSGSTVNVLLGQGNGTFLPRDSYLVNNGPSDIGTGDLDGDGILDLATVNMGSDAGGVESMCVLFGQGDGTFSTATCYEGAYCPDLLGSWGIKTGDPDGDGDLDLMVSNSSSNDVSFYANRGDGTFESHVRYGVGPGARDFVYADFTGDGIADIVACNEGVASGPPAGVTVVRGLGAAPVGVEERIQLPAQLVLDPGSPNPFRDVTRLSYSMPGAGHRRLQVFDVSGRLVSTLEEGFTQAGHHVTVWDGRSTTGEKAHAGVYFVRFQAGGEFTSRKVVLVR